MLRGFAQVEYTSPRMGKAKLRSKKAAPVATDQIDKSLAVFAARKDFVTLSVNMGWQLAITILVPVIIGVQLDKRLDSAPSYTLAALFLAIGMSVVVINKTIKQVGVKAGKK